MNFKQLICLQKSFKLSFPCRFRHTLFVIALVLPYFFNRITTVIYCFGFLILDLRGRPTEYVHKMQAMRRSEKKNVSFSLRPKVAAAVGEDCGGSEGGSGVKARRFESYRKWKFSRIACSPNDVPTGKITNTSAETDHDRSRRRDSTNKSV